MSASTAATAGGTDKTIMDEQHTEDTEDSSQSQEESTATNNNTESTSKESNSQVTKKRKSYKKNSWVWQYFKRDSEGFLYCLPCLYFQLWNKSSY